MVMSKAATVQEYLDELPPERRKVIATVRKVIRKNLPKGYREAMGYGMINYEIPLERYPVTYNKRPLCYAALAAQKNYFAVYLMTIYSKENEKTFREAYTKTGKTLDCGKCCVRFKSLDDLPLDLIGKEIASMPVDKWIEVYEKSRKKKA